MIRDARESDLDAIVRIYNAAIPGRLATADTEPISVESRRPWLREHDATRHPLWVLERDGGVVACGARPRACPGARVGDAARVHLRSQRVERRALPEVRLRAVGAPAARRRP